MPSTSEVGHAKNVANFHDLIIFCQGFGSPYNPTKESLKIPNLLAQKTTAQNLLAAVIPKKTAYDDGVNLRINAFEGLKKISTRIINALQSTDATNEKIADAKTYNKKIQGFRNRASQSATTISANQLSYDQLIQHFEGLISVLTSEASYNPNESELKIASLQDMLDNMKQKNNDLAPLYTEVSNARLQRNNNLYHPETGLVATASDIKKYVKSVFGASSPEYLLIKGIQFRTVPN